MIESSTIGEGRFLRLVSRGGWEFATRVNATGVVAVIAVTERDELILVEQHRPPIGASVIELPAGLVGDGPSDRDEHGMDAAERTKNQSRAVTPR
ncbi:MAG: hypothetical protein AAFN41_08410, partial [Planctomycetota bacterium]